jgi:hypothetical protein
MVAEAKRAEIKAFKKYAQRRAGQALDDFEFHSLSTVEAEQLKEEIANA